MQYILENASYRAAIDGRGAELCSLLDKRCEREYIWQGDPAIWAGRSPILFPMVGKLKEDAYLLGEKKYPMPKHGFAKTSEFSLSGKSECSLSLVNRSPRAGRAVHFSCSHHPTQMRCL